MGVISTDFLNGKHSMKKNMPFYYLHIEIHVKLEHILNVDLQKGYLDTYISLQLFQETENILREYL